MIVVTTVVPKVPGLDPISLVAIVPSVAGLEPDVVTTVVPCVVSILVSVVPKVPCEVCELPVVVSGPLEEPWEVVDVLVELAGGVMIHLHALLTLSVLF